MAGKKLAANVSVNGVTYMAGETPPADVASMIDNPKAWGDEPASEESKPARKTASRSKD